MAFSETEIQNLIAALHRKYSVFELSQDILLKASQIRDFHNFFFWDSIVAASALDCDANYLISEGIQNGFLLENNLKIINPFAKRRDPPSETSTNDPSPTTYNLQLTTYNLQLKI